jgi:hypothetical protein
MTKRIAKALPIMGCLLGACFGAAAMAANPFVSRHLMEPRQSATPAGNPEIPESEEAQVVESGFISRFPESGFGDLSIVPFENATSYKLNFLNFNLVLGEKDGRDMSLPFQLFYGDSSSEKEEKSETNAQSLIDPTQGLALQFPLVYLFRPENGIFHFSSGKGYLAAGADLTLRGVEISAEDAEGETSKKQVFGGSVGIRVSAVLPVKQILNLGGSKEAGYLGIGAGARLYHHQNGGQGILVDPGIEASSIGKRFSAITAEAELSIHKLVKLRFEYFKPLQDKDVLKKVHNFSFVFTPSDDSSED